MDAVDDAGEGWSRGGRIAIGVGGFVGLAGLITAATLVLGSSEPVAAADLVRFSSCTELEAWTDEVNESANTWAVEETLTFDDVGGSAGAPTAAADEAARTSAAPTTVAGASEFDAGDGAAGSGGDTGGTNTVVEGVDEIDIIDRVGDDRLLVSRNGALALVDLTGRRVVAERVGIPFDGRISVAGDLVWVAGSSPDGLGTRVDRIRISGDSFVDEGSWTTNGYLLDARRTGDRLHVVVVDQPYERGVIPFADGPVPCDQVWHPTADATTAAATLVVSLPAAGDLAPLAAAEVTGSGGNILVTNDSLYVATETWPGGDGGDVSTGLHRFDLETLAPTGSGAVPGRVAGRYAIDEYEGHLRVATSLASFGSILFEGDVVRPLPAVDDAVVGAPDIATSSGGEEQTDTTNSAPVTTEPDPGPSTETTVPETTTTEPETTTTVPETTTTVPETTTTVVPEPVPAAEDALAEVFVLDTEGDLDLVGRSGRFGRDFETIQGVRFVGDFAYVVTFLQTDPFWVIDLADPRAPRIAGEAQVPGFSAYLHPAGEGKVVGFGPDGSGSTTARLFDVTDPTLPRLVDEIRLADDSPIVWDPHAYVSLDGGEFAVPVNDWATADVSDCPVPLPGEEPLPVDPGIGGGTSGSTGTGTATPTTVAPTEPGQPEFCQPVFSGGATGAVVLRVDDDRLVEVERATIATDGSIGAERVVQAPDGSWLVLSWDRIVPVDGGQEIRLPADPASGIVVED